jgi:hypothetical protein
MLVRLTQKLADSIDGIDLSGRAVGDAIEVSPREASLLIAEGWAELVPGDNGVQSDTLPPSRKPRSDT